MAMPLSGGAERAAGGGGIHSNDRLSALLPQVCHMVAISRQGNTAYRFEPASCSRRQNGRARNPFALADVWFMGPARLPWTGRGGVNDLQEILWRGLASAACSRAKLSHRRAARGSHTLHIGLGEHAELTACRRLRVGLDCESRARATWHAAAVHV